MVNQITPEQYQKLNAFEPFQKKAKGNGKITHESAVKILRNIERTSNIKAFLTKKVVIISAGTVGGILVGAGVGAAIIYGLGLPLTVIVALKITKVALAFGLLGQLSSVISLRKFSEMREEYQDQARIASQLIKMLNE